MKHEQSGSSNRESRTTVLESLAYGFFAMFSHFRHLVSILVLAQEHLKCSWVLVGMGIRPFGVFKSCVLGLVAPFGSST